MKRRLYLIMSFVTMSMVALACGGGGSTPAAAPTQAPQEAVAVVQPPSGQACKVPDIVGLPEAQADSMLRGVGLQPLKSVQHDPTIANGAVISQDPPANTRLEPCQGDIEIVISLGPPPLPTDTPGPTATFTPIPPTATPTPDPRLFWDDFENGLKPEWGSSGNGFSSTNGKLIIQNGLWESSVIANNQPNYKITLDDFRIKAKSCDREKILQFQFRIQDKDNYMLLKGTTHGNQQGWAWFKVIAGQEQPIPGTEFGGYYFQSDHTPWITAIEVQDNAYRTFVDGEQEIHFFDDTFQTGGVLFRLNGCAEIGGVEIRSLP